MHNTSDESEQQLAACLGATSGNSLEAPEAEQAFHLAIYWNSSTVEVGRATDLKCFTTLEVMTSQERMAVNSSPGFMWADRVEADKQEVLVEELVK